MPPGRALALSVALTVPVLVPYAIHLFGTADGLRPTGFIQADMPIYMAKAREYVDDGFHWTYANPSASDYGGPRIYFQPWSLALGVVFAATGWDVGAIFLGFWAVSVVACSYVALRLYEEVAGLGGWPERLGLVVFLWGGGVLALSGVALGLVRTGSVSAKGMFVLDPAFGWWFLNFGRNLMYPTEAFYHLLFVAAILLTLRRRLVKAGACVALMAASHPFTGLELAAVLWAWLLVEVVFLEDREHLARFFAGVSVILVGELAYYLGFLNLFPEHRLIQEQMSLEWGGLQAENFVPAYALVAGLALWRLRNIGVARVTLGSPRDRLFLVWAVVAFGLANHEFAITPHQPIHFTRGYIWTALFLLGLPSLLGLFRALGGRTPRPAGIAGLTLVVGLLVFDNLAWFARFPAVYARKGEAPGIRLRDDQRDVLAFLADRRWGRHTLVSEEEFLGYLATAYTPLRAWVSHWIETPEYEQRSREVQGLFREGAFLPAWAGRPAVFLMTRPDGQDDDAPDPAWVARNGLRRVFQNPGYRVYAGPRPSSRVTPPSAPAAPAGASRQSGSRPGAGRNGG